MKIGELLRTNREKRGLSLLDVENETKIRAKYLAALESENFEEIPGEVYLLGFLRNYARYLDLNPDEIISQYKSRTKKSNQEIIPPPVQGAREPNILIDKLSKFASLLKNKALFIGVILAFTGVLLIFAILGLASNKKTAPPAPVSPPPYKNQLPPSPPVKREGVEVKLVGKELCWIQVKVDGKEEFSGFLNPEETKKFQAQEAIWLKLGNAGGVVVFYNGKGIPPLGQRGEVVVKEFVKSE
ncbi:MAG: helix-turn-helix domain-containing protein [Firmicutes bacterium]|nr:helix-turn-helix domain-containing protein [Bacillota bacterium]